MLAKKLLRARGRKSYPDGLVVDRILGRGHVLHVRRREGAVDIATHNGFVRAHRFNEPRDHVGQALGARAYLLRR